MSKPKHQHYIPNCALKNLTHQKGGASEWHRWANKNIAFAQ